MLLNASKLVKKARRHLLDEGGQQQGNSWTDEQIVAAMNEEQDDLVAVMIESSEDWYGAVKEFDAVAGQSIYTLFDGLLKLRLLELGGDSTVGATYAHAIESRLIEGVSGHTGLAVPTESEFWYAIWDDDFHIQPTPSQGITKFGRAWFIRIPGPIVLETISSSPAADKVRFSLGGDTPAEDDIMEEVVCDVVSGTGAGQRRKVIAWDGDTREATVDSGFSPALDGTSKIATVSRIPQLFATLLHLGAAMRLLVDLREDARGIAELHERTHERFIDFLDKRTGAQRGPVPWDPEGYE